MASGLMTFGSIPPYSGFLSIGRISRPVATITVPTSTRTCFASAVKSMQLVGQTFSHLPQKMQCSRSRTAFWGMAFPWGM